jgi:hypothetical protein
MYIKKVASISLLMALVACGGGGVDSPSAPPPSTLPETTPSPTPTTPSATPTTPSPAAAAALVSCAEDNLNTSPIGDASYFLTQPASQVSCLQALVFSTFTGALDGKRYVAGFASQDGLTLSETSQYSTQNGPSDRRVFSNPWVEKGDTGNVGELWWGRSGTEHIAIGQLAWVRQAAQYKRALNVDALLRISNGQLNPFSSTVELTYEQIGSTSPTYSNGSGGLAGRAPVAPGSVSGATLKLNPVKPINGVLNMNIEVDGHTLARTMPLRENTKSNIPADQNDPDKLWALKAAPAIGSNADCFDSNGFNSEENCFFPAENSTSGRRLYSANVQFFGGNAEFAVVRYVIRVDSPQEKLTTNNEGQGLIVLRLKK